MSKYFTDKHAMTCPWTMSPFFYELLRSDLDLTFEERQLAQKFYEDGYVTIDLNLSDYIIEKIKNDVAQNIGGKTQDEGYHYSKNPRVFEAWKWSSAVRDIANNPKVISTLEMLFDRKALPFQTINFISLDKLIDDLKILIQENNIKALIIGDPINMDGSHGKASQSIRDKSTIISKKIEVPSVLWDERLSTVGAFNLSSQLDVNVSKRTKNIDKNAATFILQGAIDYLNN